MLVTQGNVAAIFKGYTVKFWEAFTASAAPMSENLVMNVPSTGLSEQHNWLAATAGIRKLVDEAQINDLQGRDFTIVNDEFEETLGLKEIEVKADRFGLLAPRLSILGANARYWPDLLMADLLVKGLDGTGKDYTGTAFFGTDKQFDAASAKFTNVGTAKLDIDGVAYAAAKANILARTNSKGRPLNLGMDLRLIVSAKNADLATRLLKGDNIAAFNAGKTAVAAVSNPYKGTAQAVVWPQLDASGLEDAWFLADFGAPMKPFIKQELIPWTYYTVDNPNDAFVTLHHKFIYQIYSSGAMGYGFPETIYGSDGSA